MPDETVDTKGRIRKLGWIAPSTEDQRKMRASTTSIQTLLAQRGKTLIPENEWQPVDFVSPLPRLINDQRTSSGCVGWSAIQAFRRMRIMRGMVDQILSEAFLYALINGGSDNGAVITEALKKLMEVGACLRSEFDYPKLFKGQIPASAYETAKRFKLVTPITVDNSLEVATCVQLGIPVVAPICADNYYNSFDANGISKASPSTQANHSIGIAGMKKIEGIWVFIQPGSWGADDGPFVGTPLAGCRLLRREAIDNCDYEDDGFAILDGTWDKNLSVGAPQ